MSLQSFIDLDQQTLPIDFADQLLELELKIDTDEYTIAVMQKLN